MRRPRGTAPARNAHRYPVAQPLGARFRLRVAGYEHRLSGIDRRRRVQDIDDSIEIVLERAFGSKCLGIDREEEMAEAIGLIGFLRSDSYGGKTGAGERAAEDVHHEGEAVAPVATSPGCRRAA